MTNGIGSKSVPKDVRFESILLKEFHKEKFEKIIYYDSAIIVKDGKRYGKIIIFNDSVYSFIDSFNKFSVVALFRDIASVEMVSDKPMFIFGHQRNKVIHIRINYYTYVTVKASIPKSEKLTKSQKSLTESENNEIQNEQNNKSIDSSKLPINPPPDDVKQIQDSIDYYILNINSAAFTLLKKARIDYLIRETMGSCLSTINSGLYLSQALLNRLFDDLFIDMLSSQASLTRLQEYLTELIEAGKKYYRIKVLFWSKPKLFYFMVTQFNNIWNNLSSVSGTSQNTKILVFTHLSALNTLLNVFNTYLFETDHFETKSKQLQINNGMSTLSLIQSDLSLIAYLNDCDKNNELNLEPSELELEIDCLKHSITFSSIEFFYHLLCSSEVSVFDNNNENSFTIRSLLFILESLVTFDCQDGIFNKFISQTLHMQFIWIFPKMFKFDDQKLTPEKIINVYQFFCSVRIIIKWVPKFFKFFQKEMGEEFQHFVLNDLSFPADISISSVTLKLLKSFQKNIINKNGIFLDYV